jgi:hypothetical protein
MWKHYCIAFDVVIPVRQTFSDVWNVITHETQRSVATIVQPTPKLVGLVIMVHRQNINIRWWLATVITNFRHWWRGSTYFFSNFSCYATT